ncbi:VOC family protein [Arenibacter algicola]|uniref:VOC family protein n=1 Tax=Arenibacter algicola TaxID=616991 RepID=UPI001C064B06|nr:VOC family protein [Arenibacter algicola]MBU2905353.1 VOC family protein [Arenibacter algicola]
MEYTFSHIGIPTNEERNWDGFYEPGKIHYTEFDKDQYKIEWVKFDNDSPMPEMMQTLPHVAYLVDDMEQALKGCEILVETFSPVEGVRVAFIVHKGSPVEFMEISK